MVAAEANRAETPRNFLPKELDLRVAEFLKAEDSITKAVKFEQNYSDAEKTLLEVGQTIEHAERWKELGSISLEDKTILHSDHNQKIYDMLHKVLYSEDKRMIKKMSL